MLKELTEYDWEQALSYGSKPSVVFESDYVPNTAFCNEDVVEIIDMEEGENDGREWVIVGKLVDGRFFYLEAGCDYTGWDCQANGSAWVSSSLENLYQFGMTDKAKERLKKVLPYLEDVREQEAARIKLASERVRGCSVGVVRPTFGTTVMYDLPTRPQASMDVVLPTDEVLKVKATHTKNVYSLELENLRKLIKLKDNEFISDIYVDGNTLEITTEREETNTGLRRIIGAPSID